MEEKDIFEYNVGDTEGYHHSYQEGMDQTPLSMGEWVITILVLMIPIAGLVLYCMWAFGKSGNINRRNYCRAYLAVAVISTLAAIVICLIFFVIFGMFSSVIMF